MQFGKTLFSILILTLSFVMSAQADLRSSRFTSVLLLNNKLYVALVDFSDDSKVGKTYLIEYNHVEKKVIKRSLLPGLSHIIAMIPVEGSAKLLLVSQDLVAPQTSAIASVLNLKTYKPQRSQSLDCASFDRIEVRKDQVSLECERPEDPSGPGRKVARTLEGLVGPTEKKGFSVPQLTSSQGKLRVNVVGDWPEWETIQLSTSKDPIRLSEILKAK